MRHVIIGAGAAGISAVRTLRRYSDDEIILLSEDERVYSRCMLHKYLCGERPEDLLGFVGPDFFAQNNVRWIKGGRVLGVEPESRSVIHAGGRLCYGKLLLATGVESVWPDIPGMPAARNAAGFRTLREVKAIGRLAKKARTAVVIGGGLVGLYAAYALTRLGCRATVVEAAPGILQSQLDADSALAYQRLFEEKGCRFALERTAANADVKNGLIRSVLLDDGTELACDLVICAMGVKPAVSYLDQSGILCGQALEVDERQRTGSRDIYAAGDVTGLSGIWQGAVMQGEVAGMNMLGRTTSRDEFYAHKNSINLFGLQTICIGKPETAPDEQVVTNSNFSRRIRVKTRGRLVTGVTIQGDVANCGFWHHVIQEKIPLPVTEKPVWELNYADFFDWAV